MGNIFHFSNLDNPVQKVLENAFFRSFSVICELSPPPFPHINVENCYFCVAHGSAVKIINMLIGGGERRQGMRGKMFSKIFLQTSVVRLLSGEQTFRENIHTPCNVAHKEFSRNCE